MFWLKEQLQATEEKRRISLGEKDKEDDSLRFRCDSSTIREPILCTRKKVFIFRKLRRIETRDSRISFKPGTKKWFVTSAQEISLIFSRFQPPRSSRISCILHLACSRGGVGLLLAEATLVDSR